MNHDKSILSTKVNSGIAATIDKIADEMEETRSDFIRDAIMKHLSTHTQINLEEEYPELKKHVERSEYYRKQYIDIGYVHKERDMEVHMLKAGTVFDHLDKTLGEIYKRNKSQMSNETIKEIMIAYLHTVQDRIEFYDEKFEFLDFKKEFEYRLESPIDYAQEKLEELRKHEMLDDENCN